MSGPARTAALAALLLLAACGEREPSADAEPRQHDATMQAPAASAAAGSEDAPASGTAPGAAPEDAAFEGTAGITDRRPAAVGVTTLTAVRTGRQQGYDRVVFEFAGDRLPGYHVEYIDRPVRRCASGNVVPLAGNAWLQVRMSPARAHDDAGNATVAEQASSPGLPAIRELKSTCDFEAQLDWVLGAAGRHVYRVLELRSPARLVVDVLH